MNSILEIRGLCKKYETFTLNDISFEMPAGYIMGFIGPNGAGKTTTIKSILNMIGYEAGEIKLFGKDSRQQASTVYEQVGVVMDSPFYVDDWTVCDVEKALSPYYKRWDKARFESLLNRFDLARKKKVKDLSRGMKVKLMMAAALSHDAKLLILDEPTSGLDPVARDELCELLAEFVMDENKGVLFSTHITADLEKIADYITFIQGGNIVYTGTRDSLTETYALIKGGIREIDAGQKKYIIGLREHETGFEGMIETANIKKVPQTLLIEPISLDEIVIFMNREARVHE